MTSTTTGVAGAGRIPDDRNEAALRVGKRAATLTNLAPSGTCCSYYADVAPVLMP